MSGVVSHRPAVLADAAVIAPLLRAEERAEIQAERLDIVAALERAIRMSDYAVFSCIDGEPAAIWGVAHVSLLAGHAVPWALTTPVIERKPKAFYRECKKIIKAMRALYGTLDNYVDGRHRKALRWAERLGFKVGVAVPVGKDRTPFYKISMGGAACVS